MSVETIVTSVADFRFPSWPISRILKEACAAWNLRHDSADHLDPEASPWDQKLLAACFAWLRHSVSAYDQMLESGADRDTLRRQIHAAARRQLPWLSLDSDPRTRFRASPPGGSVQPTRRLDRLSRAMSEALDAKQAALVGRDRERARELDRHIAKGLDYCQWARGLASPGFVEEALSNGFEMACAHRGPDKYRYVFEDRGDLAENLTLYLPTKCQRCGARVRRTKRELDLGGGVRLYAMSCLCCSTLLPRSLCHVPQGLWDSITVEKVNL